MGRVLVSYKRNSNVMKRRNKTKSQIRNDRNLRVIKQRISERDINMVVYYHAYRFNGAVDLYKKMHTVHDIDTDEFHHFTTPHVALKFALDLAEEKKPPVTE